MTESPADILEASRPRLAPGVRMLVDRATGQEILVFSEAIVELKGPGPAIVGLCDGRNSIRQIVEILSRRYNAPADRLLRDVTQYLDRLHEKRLIEFQADDSPTLIAAPPPKSNPKPIDLPAGAPRPLGLIAEVTYRCPLHCPYCSNPTNYPQGDELSTLDWSRVLSEAADLGVIHALFSGGEPLARADLEQLISAARDAGLYTNLITSAIGLTSQRAASLTSAGLDSVQISFQADEPALADSIAGATAHVKKLQAAQMVRVLGFPLTINIVLHRGNIDRIEGMIALAEELGARRLELASTQYYGWGMRNRAALLPSREQIETANQIAADAQARLKGSIDVIYVLPDYFSETPKPCMNGWGKRYIAVNPSGQVLPCPTAGEIRNLHFDNVKEHDLRWIWTESSAFNKFRGTEWMPSPCRTCDRREIDFGGCRCQAAMLTGDAANTDPACSFSPHHHLITQLHTHSAPPSGSLNEYIYRTNPR